jgi:hypothetical protein
MKPPSQRLTRALATLVLYAAAVVWLTWPLAPSARDHLANIAGPSSTDLPYIAWALAWQTHALASDPARYLDANIYAPAPHTLAYCDQGLAALPVFAPVFLATGNPTLAINVVFFLGIVLTAWALHLVVETWTRSWLAGLVGATTFLTNPWTIPWFFGWAPTYAMLFCLPVVAYLVARPIARPRTAFALAALVALQASANMVYVAVSTFVPLAVLAAWRLARGRTRPSGVQLAGVLAVAAALLAPIYLEYASVRAENAGLERQSAWARLEMPADASGAPVVAPKRFPRLLPAALLWRRDPTWLAPSLLVLVLAGAVLAWRRREARADLESLWRHGLVWTGVGLVLSTAGLRWSTLFAANPLYVLLERLPFANAVLREHVRLGMPCVVGWAFLAGAALVACGRAAPPRHAARVRLVVATAAVVGAVLSHRANAVPMGLLAPTAHEASIGRMLATIDGGVLELPLGTRGIDPRHHAPAMYRSIGGWYRLLNGYSSYWPAGFAERMALAGRVPDDDAVARLVREADLAAVVVNLRACAPSERAEWLARAAEHGAGRLRLVVREPTELLFLVDRSALSP